ncbi:histidine phosphotransferase [Pararhodobacter marinus]|uniref:Histidine phosphotransferase n=1 Tax=Pararhodobacter marinus TaxID=2184063 RepID=A0A2U2CE12_9RHOB|nr:histidine phosphotransferase family protein [Pararhodobacter marinus]PWE30090.1 histidine phosphotransferase [Pararhodobacter marinus]
MVTLQSSIGGRMMADDELAALVGSRLCHDLVSPLGAIGNGVELLGMIQNASDELGLVEDAVQVAQARIKLFRLAFGRAHDMQDIRPSEIEEAASSLSAAGRLRIRNDIAQPLPRMRVKRLMLALLCLESALAYGGEVVITPDGVSAHAARLRIDPDPWSALAAGQPPAEPRSDIVQFILLVRTGPVVVDEAEGHLAIRV